MSVLLCSVLLFSCRKPEGDTPGNWFATTGDGLMQCAISGNTLFNVSVNAAAVTGDGVQLEGMKLCISGNQYTDTLVLFSSDTVIAKNWSYSDTLWNLLPGTDYTYCLILKDFANADTSDVVTLHTMSPGNPTVTVDSSYKQNDTLWLFGTASSHWRAMMDEHGIAATLRFYWGETQEQIDQVCETVRILHHEIVNDTLVLGFSGYITNLPMSEKLWFQAYAQHGWGAGWMLSDTTYHDLSGRPRAYTVPDPVVGSTNATIKGKPIKGDNTDVLYECGFYLSKNTYFTNEDKIVVTPLPSWGSHYSYQAQNLEPNTVYYYQAYLIVNGPDGDIYNGEVESFTTKTALFVEMDDQIEALATDTSVVVIATVSSVDGIQDIEYGFVWKDYDEENDEVDINNCLGSAPGLTEFMYTPLPAGKFGANVVNLTPETRYWFRAFVKVGNEYTYSPSKVVKTNPGQ